MERFIAERFKNFSKGLVLDTKALASYDDIIDLSIGDPDLVTDEKIIRAAMNDALSGYTSYGDPQGDPQLREAICRDWQKRYGQTVLPSEVFVSNSAGLGMLLLLIAFTDPGDEVLLLSPHYPEYTGQIRLAGGVPVEVVLSSDDGFAVTREKLEAALTEKTKMLIFNNPVNPTGVHYKEETLRLLADFAKEHGLLILADEIYTDYVYDEPFRSILTVPGGRDVALSVGSFSKNSQMAGWRVGYVVAEESLMGLFLDISDLLTYVAPSVSQRAAIKALEIREEIIENKISVFRERVEYGAERLSKIKGISIMKPRGTFYLFPSIKGTGMTSEEFCDWLLKEKHIMATPGSAFGAGGEGFVRISCTCPIEKIKEAMDRLEK